MPERHLLAQQIVEYVEEHWKRRVTVKEVAAKFSKDSSDADRLFRSMTGKTISRYVQERRKEYVLSKLRETDCYAYELAGELGYGEEHSFTRWVKNAFGMSWEELCRRHRNAHQRKSSRSTPPKNDTQN